MHVVQGQIALAGCIVKEKSGGNNSDGYFFQVFNAKRKHECLELCADSAQLRSEWSASIEHAVGRF